MQRKGQKFPTWEKIISVPSCPSISPTHLLKHYVSQTAAVVPPGALLLRGLKPPYSPLSANSVGRITKNQLKDFGFFEGFGPHSTRGAGVKLWKDLWCSAEEVCGVGKWENPNAFAAHYRRVGATKKVSSLVEKWALGSGPPFWGVHKDSPFRSAEPDWPRTPGREPDQGGMDQEGGAQGKGEPARPPRFRFHFKRPQQPGSETSETPPSTTKRQKQ